jgi:hypothetical protein
MDPAEAPNPVFLSVTFKMPTKNKFFSNLFCLLVSVGTNSFRSHQTAEIKVLLNFQMLLTEGSGSGDGSVQKKFGSGCLYNLVLSRRKRRHRRVSERPTGGPQEGASRQEAAPHSQRIAHIHFFILVCQRDLQNQCCG